MKIIFFVSENGLRIFFMFGAVAVGYIEGRGFGAFVGLVCGGALLKLIIEVSKHVTGGRSLSPSDRTPEEQFHANETLLLVLSMCGVSGGALFGGWVAMVVGLALFAYLGAGFLWLVSSIEVGLVRTVVLVIGCVVLSGAMVWVSYLQDQVSRKAENRELLRQLQRNTVLMRDVQETSRTLQQKLDRVRPMALSMIAKREFQKAKQELEFLSLINLTSFARLSPGPLREKGMRQQGEIRVLLACVYAHQAAQSSSRKALLQKSLRALVMSGQLALPPKGRWVHDCFPRSIRVLSPFVQSLRVFREPPISQSLTKETMSHQPSSRPKP